MICKIGSWTCSRRDTHSIAISTERARPQFCNGKMGHYQSSNHPSGTHVRNLTKTNKSTASIDNNNNTNTTTTTTTTTTTNTNTNSNNNTNTNTNTTTTTNNNNKQQQTTNNNKQQQTTTNNNKQQQQWQCHSHCHCLFLCPDIEPFRRDPDTVQRSQLSQELEPRPRPLGRVPMCQETAGSTMDIC